MKRPPIFEVLTVCALAWLSVAVGPWWLGPLLVLAAWVAYIFYAMSEPE